MQFHNAKFISDHQVCGNEELSSHDIQHTLSRSSAVVINSCMFMSLFLCGQLYPEAML